MNNDDVIFDDEEFLDDDDFSQEEPVNNSSEELPEQYDLITEVLKLQGINDLDKITDTNYKKYCFWVEAKDLDPQIHRLVEITP
jgi:hypothetical protein